MIDVNHEATKITKTHDDHRRKLNAELAKIAETTCDRTPVFVVFFFAFFVLSWFRFSPRALRSLRSEIHDGRVAVYSLKMP